MYLPTCDYCVARIHMKVPRLALASLQQVCVLASRSLAPSPCLAPPRLAMRKEPVFVPSTSDTRSTGSSTRSVILSLSLSLLVALLLLRARLPKHAAQASIQAVHPAGIRPADVGSSTAKPLAVSLRRAEQAPQSGSSTSSVACPPHHTGDACDRPLFPACAVMWGFELGLNPCANYPYVHEELQFPLTLSLIHI